MFKCFTQIYTTARFPASINFGTTILAPSAYTSLTLGELGSPPLSGGQRQGRVSHQGGAQSHRYFQTIGLSSVRSRVRSRATTNCVAGDYCPHGVSRNRSKSLRQHFCG